MKKTRVILLSQILLLQLVSLLFAFPEGLQVESGDVSVVSPDASTINISASDKSVINFKSFDIAPQETVNFIQPSSEATLLSRVVADTPSIISGTLKANGILFLINANGIYFSPSANVSVNTLVASTLDISTHNFIAGNYVFEQGGNPIYSQVFNEGSILGNNIALMASAVNNSGVITAQAGRVHLASGDKTTVTFDAKGLIQVEINSATSAKVFDSNGVSVKDSVANSGTIQATQVIMSAQTAQDIFENAVNQTGIVKATGLLEENGIIRIVANTNIQAAGTLDAEDGNVEVSAKEAIIVNRKLRTKGNTKLSADKDILVDADIETDSGNLELLADSDLDGLGAFKQAQGTFISTVNFGDIIIQSSGESTLANINSAGSLILKQAGAPAIFNQWPDSHITTKGSLQINKGVTLNASNTIYEIAKDWLNLGNFNAQISRVSLVSEKEALVRGNNIFYDFSISVPGKIVRFDAEETQAIIGTLVLKGEYAKLLVLQSIKPPAQWKILPQGDVDIAYVLVGDSVNIRGPPLEASHSSSLGNNSNWDLDPYWKGEGLSENWSDPDNWDSGTIPTKFDTVTFNGSVGINPHKNSTIDSLFNGTIDNLILDGYTGTLTLARDLSLKGDFTHRTGNFQPVTYSVTFIDSSKPSYIYGNNTFYNLTSLTPGKELYFEDGATQTVLGSLVIEGKDTDPADPTQIPKQFLIKLRSTDPDGVQWKLDARGLVAVNYVILGDAWNLGTQEIKVGPSFSFGNNTNWDLDPTWDNGAATVNWSDANNWNPNGVPGSADTVTFDGTSVANSTVDASFAGTITALNINSGYTGTLTLARSLTVTGSETVGFTQAAGTFDLGAQTLTINGVFTITGGTFTESTSTVTFDGTLDSNVDVVTNETFYNLTINKTSTDSSDDDINMAASDTLIVTGTLTLTDGQIRQTTIPSGGTIELQVADGTEDLSHASTFSGGTGVILISGAGTDTYTLAAASFCGLTLNAANVTLNGPASGTTTFGAAVTIQAGTFNFAASSTGSLSFGTFSQSGGTFDLTNTSGNMTFNTTFTLSGGTFTGGSATLDFNDNFTLSGGTFALGSGGNTFALDFTISGTPTFTEGTNTVTFDGTLDSNVDVVTNETFYNLTINKTSADSSDDDINMAASDTLIVTGTLTLTDGQIRQTTISSGGTVAARGAITQGSAFAGGTGSLVIDGTGNQTFTGGGSATAGDLSDVTINKASGTLTLSSTLRTTNDWTYTTGTVDATTNDSTVVFAGTLTLDGQGTSATMAFDNLDFRGTTVTLGGNLDVDGNLTLTSGTLDVSASNYSINVAGNWTDTSTGTFTEGSGTVTFDGSGTINSNEAFNAVTINTSGTVTLGANLQLASGNTLTVSAGTLSLAGFNVTGATGVSNSGTIRLQGGESVSWTTNDTDSGTYEYVGDGDGTAENFNLKHFTGTDYYNLTINDTNATKDSFLATEALTIAGALAVSSGTYNANANTTTVTGLATVNGGTYQASTAAQTLNGGLTVSSGTFTGSSGDVDVNGVFTLSGGTFTAPTTMTVSSDFTVSGTPTFTEGTGTITLDGGAATIDVVTNETFYNLTINSTSTKTVANSDTLIVTNTLTLTDGSVNQTTIPSGGTIAPRGAITQGSGFDGGTGSLVIDGTGNQTFTGGGSATAGDLSDVTINKASGTLTLSSTLRTTNDWTYTAGTVDATTNDSTVVFAGTLTLDGQGTSATMAFDNLDFRGTTVTLGGNLDVDGNLTITSGTLDVSASNYSINVAGNWTDTGTFTYNSGTVTLDGADQTISGATTFNNLTKTVTSAATLTFPSGVGNEQTIVGTLTLQGAAGQLLSLRSSTNGTQWRIDPQGTRTISYLDVKDSNNINATAIDTAGLNITNSGNNTGWTFGKSFSGTVYTDEGTTNIGANKTVAISVNGAAATTTETNSSGQYTFSAVSVSDGDIIIVYLDDETEKGCTVTVISNANLSGLDIYQNRVIVRHDYTTGFTTNANLATADNGDTDIKYSVSSNNLTLESGQELFIWGGDTYQAAGNITTPELDIRGTLNIGANTIKIFGNLLNFTGTLQGTSPFLSVDGYIGTKDNPINNISVTGTLTIHAGNMQALVSISISGGNNYSFQEPIPGFVFVNRVLLEQVGQQNFRSSLAQAGSVLYRSGPAFAPVMIMMPVFAPMAPAVPTPIPTAPLPTAPVPAVSVPTAPVPVPLPLKPSFEGVIPSSILPKAISPEAFTGITAITQLPLPVTFEGIRATSVLPPPIPKPNFVGIYSEVILSKPPSFVGISSSANLPAVVTKEVFSDAYSLRYLPKITTAQDFSAAMAKSSLTIPVSFKGAGASAVLPRLVSFEGATSATILSQPMVFTGITSSLKLPVLISQGYFKDVTVATVLTEPLKTSAFMGVSVSARFPPFITRQELASAVAEKKLPLPVNPLVFEEVTGAGRIKVMFPGGQKIIPTFGVAVPLGVEKPIMEPKVKEEEE